MISQKTTLSAAAVKLRLDFGTVFSLRARQECSMDDLEAQAERTALISRMFALLTVKLEDAATIAADCQGRRPPAHLRKGAHALIGLAEEAVTVALALEAVLEQAASPPPG